MYFIKNFELNKKLYEIFYLEENNTFGEQGTGSLTNWCDLDQYTTREDKHGRVFLVPCKSERYCIVANTGQAMFYKVPETHGHV